MSDDPTSIVIELDQFQVELLHTLIAQRGQPTSDADMARYLLDEFLAGHPALPGVDGGADAPASR